MFDEISSADLRPDDLPPPNAGWSDVAPFALTFDGYDHVASRRQRDEDGNPWGELAEEIRAAMERSGDDPVEYSLDDLRAALFWWQRVAHWSRGIVINGQALRCDPKVLDNCHRLIECIRQRLKENCGA